MAATVTDLTARIENLRVPKLPIDGGGGDGEDGSMNERLTALETKLETVLPTLSTKADLAELRADMHDNNSSIKNWMIATIISLFVGFAGLFFAMSNALKPSQPTPQQAPIIINVPPVSAGAPVNPTAPSRP